MIVEIIKEQKGEVDVDERSSSLKILLAKICPVVIVIGYLSWFSVFFLPVDFLTSFLGTFRWGGFATMVLCPLLGVFSLAVSRWTKNNKWMWWSLPLIFAALISMVIVSVLASLGG